MKCWSALLLTFGSWAGAANNPPLSAAWNIQAAGSAASSGELLFRLTPAGGGDSLEITVSVHSGTDDIGVARAIRQTLSSQLRADLFDVQLGGGANVLVTDPHGQPDFSLELLDSNVEDLRVVVQSVDAAAPPTVPEQAMPATPPQNAPPANDVSGNALPPPANATPPNSSGGAGQPASAPPLKTAPGGAPASAAPPG